MRKKIIKNTDDLFNLLDSQFRPPKKFWDPFFSDRNRRVPIFRNVPDENLVCFLQQEIITVGKVLELGCGPGRNAIYLAKQGFSVDAYDISETAIEWAIDRAKKSQVVVNFVCDSVLDLSPNFEYDFVYDSGCMHGILPHHRIGYLKMIYNALKPNGYFGLTCFAPGYGDVGGPHEEMSDWEVYEEKTMKGGMAFSEEKLRFLLSDNFECIEFRQMKSFNEQDAVLGVPFLWVSLWKKK